MIRFSSVTVVSQVSHNTENRSQRYHDAKYMASLERQALSVKTDIKVESQERHAPAKVHYDLICGDEVPPSQSQRFACAVPVRTEYIYGGEL